VRAQQRPIVLGVGLHFGQIAPHNSQMLRLITGHSYAVSGYVQWPTLGNKPWHGDYHYPSHRLDCFVLNTGNLPQLGYQTALTYQIVLPTSHRNKSGHFNLGLGPGYASKKWDIETNRQGMVIGSHVNMALVLGYTIPVVRREKWEMQVGLRITHLSNGAFTMPNAGTNNVGVSLTWQYQKHKPELKQPTQDSISRWQWGAMLGFGLKEIQPPLAKKYAITALEAIGVFQRNKKSAFMAQMDLMYNSSNQVIYDQNSETNKTFSQSIQMGMALGYQLRFGKLGLFMQQGVYTRDTFGYDGKFYNRFGLRTYGRGPWFVQLGLKTHFAKADHGEIGVGYYFKKSQHVIRGKQ
jgi:Lipid A 3-O-deacylase (PagL)